MSKTVTAHRLNPETTNSPKRARGLSLIEMGMVMVFLSLALVPIVKMMGGPQNDSGNAAHRNSMKSKEAILANTLVDRVLANDFSYFDCNDGFNPATQLPVGTTPTNSARKYNICKAQNTNSDVYYQWSVVHLNGANNGNEMPSKNRYYQASLNILGPDRNPSAPMLTIPVNFFFNEGGTTTKTENTGVMVAMDRSGSMAWSDKPSNLPSVNGVTAPFMFYRYKAFPTGVTNYGFAFPNGPDKVVLNKWDNSQLDLVYAKQVKWPGPGPSPYKDGQDPDSTTPYNEAYPFSKVNPSVPGQAVWGDGVLGSGNCSSNSNNEWTNAASGDKNLFYTFLPEARLNYSWWGPDLDNGIYKYNGLRDEILIPLCSEKNDKSGDITKHWSYTINKRLSRFEAARTATLSLLLKLEEKANVANVIELGYYPWGSYAATEHQVALEKVKNGHFEKMREKLLWINRMDPADKNNGSEPVRLEGGTDIHRGIEYGRQQLLKGNYDRRIMVLLTDGEPSPNGGVNSNAPYGGGGLRDYVKKNLGCGVADSKKRITLFTVGLLQADEQLMADMANSTPSGQPFYAKDIASLTPIFETISYQIQKLALLSTASRYGFEFSEDDGC